MKEVLRSRAKSYRNRANISLTLIIVFIAAAVMIFYSASAISNVNTQNRKIELLTAELKYKSKRDSLTNKAQNVILREVYIARNDSLINVVKTLEKQLAVCEKKGN